MLAKVLKRYICHLHEIFIVNTEQLEIHEWESERRVEVGRRLEKERRVKGCSRVVGGRIGVLGRSKSIMKVSRGKKESVKRKEKRKKHVVWDVLLK